MNQLEKFMDVGMAAVLRTGDFGLVLFQNPVFSSFGGGHVHKADLLPCKYKEAMVQLPPDTHSKWELLEFDTERKCESHTYKWVIVHWLVSPSGILRHQTPIECLFFFPNTTKKTAYADWDRLKKIWTRNGFFTLKEHEERVRHQDAAKLAAQNQAIAMAGKLKPVKKTDGIDIKAAIARVITNAQLKVAGKSSPKTIEAIKTKHKAAAQIADMEMKIAALIPSGSDDFDHADYQIVKAFTKAHLTKSDWPSNKDLAELLEISTDAVKQRIVRLDLDGIRPRGPRAGKQ